MIRALSRLRRGGYNAGRRSDDVELIDVRERELANGDLSYRARARGSQRDYNLSALVSGKTAQVHCDCDDYSYTFYPTLHERGIARREIALPKPKGTGPARATSEIGVCKHLMALIEREIP